jgi:hypothetical protein
MPVRATSASGIDRGSKTTSTEGDGLLLGTSA